MTPKEAKLAARVRAATAIEARAAEADAEAKAEWVLAWAALAAARNRARGEQKQAKATSVTVPASQHTPKVPEPAQSDIARAVIATIAEYPGGYLPADLDPLRVTQASGSSLAEVAAAIEHYNDEVRSKQFIEVGDGKLAAVPDGMTAREYRRDLQVKL